MSKTPNVPQFNLLIDGKQAPKDVMRDMLECTVENSLHLPDACAIRVHDGQFQWIDSDIFQEGNSMVVEAGWGEGPLAPIFYGEIVGLEFDMAGMGAHTIVVRCLDRSHRLGRGRKSRAFMNVKDSDLVKKIGAEVDLSVVAESTSEVHDWVLQNNQTNWEFLCERARRNGFRLYCMGEKELRFEKVKDAATGTVELEWGSDLRSFRPRTSLSQQVDEVIVQGWDPKTKVPIVGRATKGSGTPKVGEGTSGAEVAKRAFGAAQMVVCDRPVHSQSEADDLARSLFDEIANEYLQADGLCEGNPKVAPGVYVEILNIGQRFKGSYLVTSTLHTYSEAEGYSTQFSITGKSPNTVLSLLDRGGPGGMPIGGNVVIGVVTDNKDPDGLGRVKVKYPWLTEKHSSFWARVASQMAGSGRGMFNLPEIDDEVLVVFEHGEVSRPFVIGQLWNGKDRPPSISGTNPELSGKREVNRRGFYSRVGHMMDFDDTGGGGIKLTTQGGIKVHLEDSGPVITCSTPGGQSITINDAGAIITLKDNAGDVMTMSNGMVNVSASTMMNLTAPMINITGTVSVTVNGMAITVTAGAMASVAAGALTSVTSGKAVYLGAGDALRAEAGGKAELQGKGGVEIDGKPAVEVKGTVVKLN